MNKNILKDLSFYFKEAKIEDVQPEFVPYSFPENPQNLQTLQNQLGRKWAVNFENLYFLSLCVYNKNLPSYVTSISTKGIAKKCRFNSYQSASNLLELAKKINLIHPAHEVGKSIESYCTGGTGIRPYAKRYHVNTALAKFIIQEYEKICVKSRKNPKVKRKKGEAIPNAYIFPKKAEKAILKSVKNKDFDAIKEVKFGGNKGIAGFTQDEILYFLTKKYKQILYFQRFYADELNRNEPLQELQKVFIPHITMPQNSNRKHEKKAGIVRLGIRDTCQACSFKKGTEQEDIERAKKTNKPLLYTGGYRGDFLAKVFQGKEYTEFDVNASIYRITLLLKNGIWPKEEGKDLYNSFIGTDCGEFRPFVKLLAMIIYFQADRTVRQIANSDSCRKVFGKNVTFQDRIDFVTAMKQNMQRVLGDSLGSEVFLHESCIYMRFNYELQKLGYRVVQIYDGFYTDAPKDFNFEALLIKVAEWYYDAFIRDEKSYCHRLSA